MILYHVTYKKKATSILKRGFRDGVGRFLTDRRHRGVWLSDRPFWDGNDWNSADVGTVALKVTMNVTEAKLAEYEWREEGKLYREWLIPAAFIHAHGIVELLKE